MPGPFPSRRLIWLAFLSLWMEKAWPALWPVVVGLCLFLAAAASGLFERLPGLWHLALLIVCGLAIAGLALHGVRRLSLPARAQAIRRIERDSALAHRPLSSADDALLLGENDSVSRALWEEHRRRLQQDLDSLRVSGPLARIGRNDPLRLRFIAPLALVAALFAGGGETPGRLATAFAPDLSSLRPPMPYVQVWLTPPAYTRQPPVLLENLPQPEDSGSAPLSIPVGSTILALAQGGWSMPSLVLSDGRVSFERQSENDWRLEGAVLNGETLRVEQDGRTVGEWSLTLVPDQPPAIQLTEEPLVDPRGRFRLSFEAQDDYGIATIEGTIRLVASDTEEPLVVELIATPNYPATLKTSHWVDLAAHRWAGRRVNVQLQVRDQSGQTGESQIQPMILPERVFTDPAAVAVTGQRRALMRDGEEARETAIRTLRAYARHEDVHRNRPVITLALAVASARLFRDRSTEGMDSVLALLWDTAVALEDGILGDTARALEQARRDLEEALAANLSEAEIQARIDRLEQALANHLRAMMQTMQQQNAETEAMLDDIMEGIDVNALEIGDMLEQMRSLAQMGAREAAQDALNRMSEMLERLQNARPAPPMSAQEREARQAMQQMKDIVSRQRRLIDDTFQIERQDTLPTPQQTQALRERQNAIRNDLNGLRTRLDNGLIEVPESLGQAEGAMEQAEGSLRRQDVGEAQLYEEEALELLEQGMQEGQQSLMQAAGQRLRLMLGGRGGGNPMGSNADPFGRNRSPSDDGSTRFPSQSEAQKAQQIMEELRRRAGELGRPEGERNYLNRLLRRF